MNKERLAITLGDPWGIGPEVTIKALDRLNLDYKRIVVIGPESVWKTLCSDLSISKQLVDEIYDVSLNSNFINTPGEPPENGGTIPLKSLDIALDLIKSGSIKSLVTAPINKSLIQKIERYFVGHTEYLGNHFEVDEPTMFFVGPKIKTGLVTTHVSIRDLPNLITKERILIHLRHINDYLNETENINKKIGVCGLNPHAGENGKFGREEVDYIKPAVDAAVLEGINAEGPYPADTIYKKALDGTYSVILAMYHDQALTLFKTTDQDMGVNVTLGLPVLRTSPDHGTAYDIAGKNIANESSMIEAIKIAYDKLR